MDDVMDKVCDIVKETHGIRESCLAKVYQDDAAHARAIKDDLRIVICTPVKACQMVARGGLVNEWKQHNH